MPELFCEMFSKIDEEYTITPLLSLNDIKIDLSVNGIDERADLNKLGFLLMNKQRVERLYRDDARNAVPLEKYMKSHMSLISYLADDDESSVNTDILKNNKFKVKYDQTTGLEGRLQANGSVSLQGMVREARHFISDDYFDIDMVNAHPIITEWICENLKIECEALSFYINDRENILKEINNYNIQHGGNALSRSFLKTYMLKIAYGCGDKAINEIKFKHPFINSYVKTMRDIGVKIMNSFKSFHALNVKRRKMNGKDYNLVGSSMSHLCQYAENEILLRMYNMNSNIHKNGGVVLCFDGLMIPRDTFNSDFTKDDFIRKCHGYFHDRGMNKFKLEIKDMEYAKIVADNLSRDNIKYDDRTDYISSWFKLEKAKRIKQLQSYEKLFKNVGFDSSSLSMEMKNILMEEVGGFYVSDFRSRLSTGIWNFTELMYFCRAFTHRFYVKMESASSKLFILNLNDEGYDEGELSGEHILINQVEVDKKGNQSISVEKIPIANFFINMNPKLIKKFNMYVFRPYTDFQPLERHNNSSSNLNVFSGYEINRYANKLSMDEVDMELVNPWLFHLKEVLCSGDDNGFQFMLRWCQILFREPRTKTRKILVFVSEGEQVGGKGTFFNEFVSKLILGKKLAGNENGLEFLNADFNKQLEGRLLTVCEEASVADGSFHKTHSKLKSYATEDQIAINSKFVKVKSVESYNNFVILSNHDNCVKIEDNEQRFVLFKTSKKAVDDNGGRIVYFENLTSKYLNSNSALHFYSYIYNLNLSHVNIKVSVKTDFYNNVKEATGSSQVKFARDVIDFVKYKSLNNHKELHEILAELKKAEGDQLTDDIELEDFEDWQYSLDNDLKHRAKLFNYLISIQKLYNIYKLWCIHEGIKKPVEKKGAFITDLSRLMSKEKINNADSFVIKY